MASCKKHKFEKLMYFTSDRAANEQKANEILNSWGRRMLQESDSEADAGMVDSFYCYCMAHTLLGFEYYILQQFKLQQKKYVDEEIKLGREMLSVYHHYTKEFAPLTEVYSTWGRLSGPSWGREKCS